MIIKRFRYKYFHLFTFIWLRKAQFLWQALLNGSATFHLIPASEIVEIECRSYLYFRATCYWVQYKTDGNFFSKEKVCSNGQIVVGSNQLLLTMLRGWCVSFYVVHKYFTPIFFIDCSKAFDEKLTSCSCFFYHYFLVQKIV